MNQKAGKERTAKNYYIFGMIGPKSHGYGLALSFSLQVLFVGPCIP